MGKVGVAHLGAETTAQQQHNKLVMSAVGGPTGGVHKTERRWQWGQRQGRTRRGEGATDAGKGAAGQGRRAALRDKSKREGGSSAKDGGSNRRQARECHNRHTHKRRGKGARNKSEQHNDDKRGGMEQRQQRHKWLAAP